MNPARSTQNITPRVRALAGFIGARAGVHIGAMRRALAHRSTSERVDVGRGAALFGELSQRGGLRVAVDGEIFNAPELAKRFGAATSGAADVIAAGYARLGEGIFGQLDGAFVAAVVEGERVVIARDALGERPVYYATTRGGFLFASEIKALVAGGVVPRPNLASLLKLVVFSFIPGVESMFEGVHELPPGHILVRDGGAMRVASYWSIRETRTRRSEKQTVEQLRECLDRAVDKRLRGIKSVAAFLSGGVDSSAVVALLTARGVDVTALSVGFGNTQVNELPYAEAVARHCGATHKVLHVEPPDFVDLLPRIIWQLDDPLCDCITVPNYLLSREAKRHADVVFNGEGGDPLFGGPKNKFMILGEWYAFLGDYDRARAYLGSYHKLYDLLDVFCTPDLMRAAGGTAMLEDVVRPYLEESPHEHFLNRLMHTNVKLKGGQNILVKVDKMLSAHGLRPASPLFDRELTELSFSIPTSMKRRGDVEKWIFKKAVEPLLPKNIVYRKKMGMGVPLNHWFRRTSLRDYALELLTSRRARERGYFQPAAIEELFSAHGTRLRVGKNRMGEIAWMLVAIELWHRVYVDTDGPRPSHS